MNEQGFEKFHGHRILPSVRKTPLPGGYMGKILRVNLTKGEIKDEALPETPVLRQYIGGQGLAQLLLIHELPSGVSALSPENPLIFMTGPLCGTGKTPAGALYSVTKLSNITSSSRMTRGAIVTSMAAGHWGPFLKFSGYDGIMVTGAAERPVYLWVEDGKAEIREAGGIWGRDSHETEDLVRKEVGQPKAKVAAIGPAGENLVKSAMILNDHHHCAAHGGGAVMGSKNLKAIAVYGTGKVPICYVKKLTEAGKRWRSKTKTWELPEGRWGPGHGEALGTLVYHNWQSTLFPDANKGFDTNRYRARPCYKCIRACPYEAKITRGEHKGYVATQGAGSEQHEALFILGIGGPDVHYLADLLDRMGIEGCQFGCAAGVAFEAFERGLITTKETDGLELKWGDVDVTEKVIGMAARREGWLGNLIAEGPKAVAEAIGEEALNMVVHIKGGGAPALHDWRPYLGQMLGQITSCGGGKPRLQGFELHGDASLGYPQKTFQIREGKGAEVLRGGAYRLLCGNTGVCWFGARGGVFPDHVDALAAVTGWDDFNQDEALAVAERTWQLEHIFHIRFGWSPEEDLENIGPRFLEPVPDGPFKGFTIAKFLPDILYEFYAECGWDKRSGRPTLETLKKYGLEEYSFLAAQEV